MTDNPLVCIVDDENGIRSLMGRALETEGHRVETFPDGESFLRFLEEDVPDLVFLDINMPGMNGWEVQQRLQNDHEVDAPVVAVTARGGDSVRVSARDGLGFADYLRKPFDLHALLDSAASLVEQR